MKIYCVPVQLAFDIPEAIQFLDSLPATMRKFFQFYSDSKCFDRAASICAIFSLKVLKFFYKFLAY